jgi:pimeloyl-ACP methyl ester carboxylesterase
MQVVDIGRGAPLVFIPGLQGRWEYMSRAVEALAGSFRVITFSLADEPAADCPFDQARPMESYVDQVSRALDAAGGQKAAICGVSFGGTIALQFAVAHAERVAALILVSTPGPHWTLQADHAVYAQHPRLTAPFFFAGMPARFGPELARAMPRLTDRARLGWEATRTLLRAPVSPSRMAARARIIEQSNTADLSMVSAPTLVIVGEESLDRMVPAEGSAEYARLIPHATLVRLERTGHQGCITRPQAFAAAVEHFLSGARHAAA